MKRFFETLRNIWRVEELKNRILVTLGLILVFRLGSFVVLPGVDTFALAEAAKNAKQGGLADILALFSGGAFSNASIMALGIMPYISASIIMQLLGMAVPAVQKMQKEGESGRKKINQWTRYLTVIVTIFQASAYVTYLESLYPPNTADSAIIASFTFSNGISLHPTLIIHPLLKKRICISYSRNASILEGLHSVLHSSFNSGFKSLAISKFIIFLI
jgi:preprotein translocase subunit SecY